VDVERLDDAGAFLDGAGRLLLADEPRHNLVLGIAGTVRAGGALYAERRFWIVRDSRRPVAAALRTPPFNLVLARPDSGAALDALVEALAGEELPGVTGALPEADAFAARWAKRQGVTTRKTMAQGVYALERVEPPPRPSGSPREPAEGDRDLVLRWWLAFAAEAIHEGGPGLAQAERAVDHRLASPHDGFLLWEDAGQPVSLAGWGGPTPNGIRIGPVYTPPELRGRGYATALTADLSQRLLDGGRRFCFLYTDLANPTANGIYERIGYTRVCESAEIAFDRS
jgi:predicted GNAT family acetyltransferase